MFKEFITFLGTKDLKTTSDFYQDVLGLTIYKNQGLCLIFTINPQSKIGFCTHMPVVHDEKSPILTLVTEEVDEIYNILINKGLKINEKPKINQKFNIYHFFLKDPNGYTIEIQKFLD
ncbi:MAG: VOC family protein [Promethearchaeota archaeon]|jgi:catechol 2,3-dioxygenase-like lactoylglutathione lyase family enzyme